MKGYKRNLTWQDRFICHGFLINRFSSNRIVNENSISSRPIIFSKIGLGLELKISDVVSKNHQKIKKIIGKKIYKKSFKIF